MSQLKSQAKGENPSLLSPLFFFFSIQVPGGLVDVTHPHRGGQTALLSCPIQMLISFGNTLTDTHINNV